MWILFALTSATILASRKVQEKQLVWNIWGALGWMIRVGSSIAGIILWLTLSRDTTGMTDTTVLIILGVVGFLLYPIQTYGYYRAIHELPLSFFGMLAPVSMLSNITFAYIFLGQVPSLWGYIGIGAIIVWLLLLIEQKNEHSKHISLVPVLLALMTYASMWLGGVLDKIALGHTTPFAYTMMNQSLAGISLFMLSFVLFDGPHIPAARKNISIIAIIGLSQGIGWLAGMYAIQWSPNVGYATALINTHAIITTLYGIIVLREGVTRKKLLVLGCMCIALASFAFA
jgi:drug/metabolite transporter (DMT)-like permease